VQSIKKLEFDGVKSLPHLIHNQTTRTYQGLTAFFLVLKANQSLLHLNPHLLSG